MHEIEVKPSVAAFNNGPAAPGGVWACVCPPGPVAPLLSYFLPKPNCPVSSMPHMWAFFDLKQGPDERRLDGGWRGMAMALLCMTQNNHGAVACTARHILLAMILPCAIRGAAVMHAARWVWELRHRHAYACVRRFGDISLIWMMGVMWFG